MSYMVYADNTYNASFGPNTTSGAMRGGYRIANSGRVGISGGSHHGIDVQLLISNSTDISVTGGVYSSDNNTVIAAIDGGSGNTITGATFKSGYAAGIADGMVVRVNSDNNVFSSNTVKADNVTTLIHLSSGAASNTINWNQYLGSFTNRFVDTDGTNYINDRFIATMTNAAGNTKRVRLNDTEDGLVYESP